MKCDLQLTSVVAASYSDPRNGISYHIESQRKLCRSCTNKSVIAKAHLEYRNGISNLNAVMQDE